MKKYFYYLLRTINNTIILTKKGLILTNNLIKQYTPIIKNKFINFYSLINKNLNNIFIYFNKILSQLPKKKYTILNIIPLIKLLITEWKNYKLNLLTNYVINKTIKLITYKFASALEIIFSINTTKLKFLLSQNNKYKINKLFIKIIFNIIIILTIFFTLNYIDEYIVNELKNNNLTYTSLIKTQIIPNLNLGAFLTYIIFAGIILLIINSIFYNLLASKGIFFITSIFLVSSLILTLIFTYATLNFYLINEFYIETFKFFNIPFFNDSTCTFFFDILSIGFIILILSIGTCVYIYSYSYFKYNSKLIVLLNLILSFMLGMIILVSASDFITLLFGWEMIGISSYLLINFWNARSYTLKSSFKATIFNKFSDSCLIIAMIIYYYLFNTFNIKPSTILVSIVSNKQLNLIFNYNINALELFSFFLMICSFIKSAQFIFHIWLPDSMEAPAPASALIHSATLVSAGIYLVLRFSYILELTYYVNNIILLFGSITAAYGAITSAYQTDLKKILAYSTISHCGFMMVCAILKYTELTIFYLFVHGCFKAAGFMCVGNIIHNCNNVQDLRKMGNLYKKMPFEFYVLTLCLLILSGFPATYGFYTKHFVLYSLSSNNNIIYNLSLLFLTIGLLASFFYFYNFIYYVFFSFKRGRKNIYNNNIIKNPTVNYHEINKNVKLKLPNFNSKLTHINNTNNGEMFAITLLTLFGFIFSIYYYYLLDLNFINKINVNINLLNLSLNELNNNINLKILNKTHFFKKYFFKFLLISFFIILIISSKYNFNNNVFYCWITVTRNIFLFLAFIVIFKLLTILNNALYELELFIQFFNYEYQCESIRIFINKTFRNIEEIQDFTDIEELTKIEELIN